MGSILPTKKLDKTNFASWEYKMHQYLVGQGQGYWSYIEGAQENQPNLAHAGSLIKTRSIVQCHILTIKQNQLNSREEKRHHEHLDGAVLFLLRNSIDQTLHLENTRCTNTLSAKAIGVTSKELKKINPTWHVCTNALSAKAIGVTSKELKKINPTWHMLTTQHGSKW